MTKYDVYNIEGQEFIRYKVLEQFLEGTESEDRKLAESVVGLRSIDSIALLETGKECKVNVEDINLN